MRGRWGWALVGVLSVLGASACRRAQRPPAVEGETATLNGHAVRLDAEGKILPWLEADSPYAEVVRRGWDTLKTRFPAQANGFPTYFAHSRFDPERFVGDGWPHNPAGLNAMFVDSAIAWHAFSGDRSVIDWTRKLLDHQLSHGTTPPDAAWANVPYASADAGSVDWHGADDGFCGNCGTGDGHDHLEPDKVGELGYAYLRFYELTGETKYRDAALHCAHALAKHVRAGDEQHSPWPFRVHAKTNVAREEYSSNVIGSIKLLDETLRLGLGDTAAVARARKLAWDWMTRHPMTNDAWSGYFEDIAIQNDPHANPNQYAPGQTAMHLLEHPELDVSWRPHTSHLLDFVARNFAVDNQHGEHGIQWGAEVLSEQRLDMWKMGSHTARWGALQAMWFEKTGDVSAKERARRSLAWATYMADDRGVISAAVNHDEGFWFSDGYGDYMRHFMTAMAAVPEWAPAQSPHLLRSSSVVKQVHYEAKVIGYTTFDAAGREVLRLPKAPQSVTSGGAPLDRVEALGDRGYTLEPLAAGGFVLRIAHTAPDVTLAL